MLAGEDEPAAMYTSNVGMPDPRMDRTHVATVRSACNEYMYQQFPDI